MNSICQLLKNEVSLPLIIKKGILPGGDIMRRIPLRLLIAFLIIMPALFLDGHTYKVPMIVDTDMGLDDLRALVMLFNSDMADIRLIVTSDGNLSPEKGIENLNRLLKYLKQEKIPTVMGRKLDKAAPPWREWTRELLSFLPAATSHPGENKIDLNTSSAIVNTLKTVDTPCLYLCLGPLTNLADAIKAEPGIKRNISRVVYYGSPVSIPEPAWNTNRDLDSAKKAIDSGMRFIFFSGGDNESLKFDRTFFNKIELLDKPASRLISNLHQSPAVQKLLNSGHFHIWDEMTVIYLNRPEIFRFTVKGPLVSILEGFDTPEVYDSYLKLLGFAADSHLLEREIVVLDSFPTKEEFFKPDLQPMVSKIISKYGMEEWKATVLTNELHRHLGIYSIIGAKMGIYAREILTAPLDGLSVVSMAGNEPPISCFNDGLQVSTGASLGRGTIQINSSSPRVEAIFIFKDQKITLKLKSEIVSQIKRDIQAAVKKYGPLSSEYFSHVRKLSIDYWYNMDRAQIFEEVKEAGKDTTE
jgi:pyrimidine-specific ribonucleoside hydrolase